MTSFLLSVFWVLVAIGVLVFVHEMGHFLSAKLFGMRVERFSIGFPPKLFGRQIGETEYVIGATPLGGYVKISGMVDESMDTEFEGQEPEPHEFRAKPVWQRIVVITAGVIFNVILAVGIFTALKMSYGETFIPAQNISGVYVADSSLAYELGLRTGDKPVAINDEPIEEFQGLFSDLDQVLADDLTLTVVRDGDTLTLQGPDNLATRLSRAGGAVGLSIDPSLVGGVSSGAPADSIGLQPGDRITGIAGEPVRFWGQMTDLIQRSAGRPVAIMWQRPDSLADDTTAATFAGLADDGDHLHRATIDPDTQNGRYVIGIFGPSPEMLEQTFGFQRRTYGLGEAIVAGAQDTWTYTAATVVGLQRVVSGRESMDSIGGPIMVAKFAKDAAAQGARPFWTLVAILSVTLAIINILPIPALDGGHLMFLLYEGITRREPSMRVRMVMQQIGMVLLLALMVFLIFNDIMRL